VENEPKLIKSWDELKECISETHILEIDVDGCNGWITHKNSNENYINYSENNHYLSTHTFYGSNYESSTALLQKCGFNVQLENWDE
jgi:hypothetical protein